MATLAYTIAEDFYKLRDSETYIESFEARMDFDTFIEYADRISKEHLPREEYLNRLKQDIQNSIDKTWAYSPEAAHDALKIVNNYIN